MVEEPPGTASWVWLNVSYASNAAKTVANAVPTSYAALAKCVAVIRLISYDCFVIIIQLYNISVYTYL